MGDHIQIVEGLLEDSSVNPGDNHEAIQAASQNVLKYCWLTF